MLGLIRDWLLDPLALLLLLSVVLGLVLRGARRHTSRPGGAARSQFRDGKRRKSRRLSRWALAGICLWFVLVVLSTAPIIVNPLVASLEGHYPSHDQCPAGSHVIVLGGGVDSRVTEANQFGAMSPATLTRATHAAHMALAEPDIRLVVAGGALNYVSEADVIATYLMTLGVSEERILRESASANTHQNALNVSELLATETLDGPLRLVTSAMHMPRALNTFKRAFKALGVSICPVSVDIQGLQNVPVYAWMPQLTALNKFDLWFHEVIALLVYRLRGWL